MTEPRRMTPQSHSNFVSSEILRTQPLHALHALHHCLVNERQDGLGECITDLLVFARAIASPVCGKRSLVDEFLEHAGLAAIAQAQKVVVTLKIAAMFVGVGGSRHFLVFCHPHIGGAADHAARKPRPELLYDKTGYLV